MPVLGLAGCHTHAMIAKNGFYLFVPVLGLAGGHCREIDTAENGCTPYNQVASLDVVPDCTPRPPAYYGENQKESQEKFYICSEIVHTHTHTIALHKNRSRTL